MLKIRIGQSISNHDRSQVHFQNAGDGYQLELFILLVDERREIGRVVSAVTLGCNMERRLRIFWEATQEEFKKCIYIDGCGWSVVDARAIGRVRVTNVDGLIEKYNVGLRIP